MRMGLQLEKQEENDETAEVTWEDQQRINTFSKLNNRIRIIQEKLRDLKGGKEALEDLSTELELSDESETVLYKVGEVFMHMPQHRALKRLEQDQTLIDENVATLALQVDECEAQMEDLKVVLYAKFGKAINLDE